jgi:hypothetical protein
MKTRKDKQFILSTTLRNNRNMKRYAYFCLKKEKCEYSFITRTSRSKTCKFVKTCNKPENECSFKTQKIVLCEVGRY